MSEVLAPAAPRMAWRTAVNWIAALLIAAVFLAAGIWKVSEPARVAVMLAQLKVPQNLSVPLALCLGIAETFTGVMLLLPRFRRWGSVASVILLLVFMAYIGLHYAELRGADCSCFPWLKRTVGPGFFAGDAVMLMLALAAGAGTRVTGSLRTAVIILSAIAALTLVSYGMNRARHTGTEAPATILSEDGKPISLREGKVFIYFFNPQCMHCLEAGRRLAALNWGDTRFVGVPTENARYGDFFMKSAHLTGKGPVSDDLSVLKKLFPFDLPPAGVALENGYERAMLLQYEDAEPAATLKRLGFVQ